MTGLFGKMPRHGDFVRRALPASFLDPWDAFLSRGVAGAREALDAEAWAALWWGAPAWRFCLAPGAAGPEPFGGVLVMSEDLVGRCYPLTIAAGLETPDAPDAGWYDACEAVAAAARAGLLDADGLFAALPPLPPAPEEDGTLDGQSAFWTAGGARLTATGLPDPIAFLRLLEPA